jgi:hypothetical protein
MKQEISMTTLFLLSLGLHFVGCGDKNLQEYQTQKVAEEISKFQSLVGIYRGNIAFKYDKTSLGVMTLEVETDSKINLPSDQPTATRQAVLKGTITIENQKKLFLSFNDGFYDSRSQEFQMNIPITRRNGEVASLQVQGYLGSGELEGTMQANAYPEQASFFKLKKIQAETASPKVISRDSSIHPEGNAPIQWVFDDLSKKSTFNHVDMFLSLDSPTDVEEFLSPFVSEKLVDVVFDLEYGTRVPFTAAKWDIRKGTMKGEWKDEDHNCRIDCASYLMGDLQNDSGRIGWNCVFRNNSQASEFKWAFRPKAKDN